MLRVFIQGPIGLDGPKGDVVSHIFYNKEIIYNYILCIRPFSCFTCIRYISWQEPSSGTKRNYVILRVHMYVGVYRYVYIYLGRLLMVYLYHVFGNEPFYKNTLYILFRVDIICDTSMPSKTCTNIGLRIIYRYLL